MTKTEEKKALEEQMNMIIEAKNNKLVLELSAGLIMIKTRTIYPKERTKAGIYLPEKTNAEAKKDVEFYYEEHPCQGVIYIIGPPKKNSANEIVANIPGEYNKGDYIYITKQAYERLNLIVFEEFNYLTIHDYEILCKIPVEYIGKRIDELDLKLSQ